ncbi:MAG TPA: hypothetical protein VF351_02145 [Actinomycetota bacterium]
MVADAATTAELARLMAIHRPDVVVLDDGIGATAVSMINEMSPDTKVVLVWPGAVMPVGGAARVEPARVLQDLGPTIARLTGQPGAALGRGAALLDRAAKDPDVLRSMLQGEPADAIIEDREPAPVVILPLTPTIDHDELVLNVPEAEPEDDERSTARSAGVAGVAASASVLAASGQAAATEGSEAAASQVPAAVTSIAGRRRAPGAQSVLNRRLGNLALGGAAVATALVLALALGDARVPIDVVRGAGTSIQSPPPGGTGGQAPPTDPGNGSEEGTPPPDDPVDPGTAASERTFPDVALVGDVSPASDAPDAPDVDVDPGDIGPGGDGVPPPDGDDPPVTGGDDHGGNDAGDHDRGGGNDDPDNGGGSGPVGDDDGSDDHDSGGGNDDRGGDHDQGGGNDDDDNPSHQHGEGGSDEGTGGERQGAEHSDRAADPQPGMNPGAGTGPEGTNE